MKNFTRLTAFILSALMIAAMLSACSASSGYNSYDSAKSEEGYSAYNDGENTSDNSKSASSTQLDSSSRKIIETLSYSVETKSYDVFLSDMEAEVKLLKGYVAHCTANNSSSEDNRYASYTVKIPTQKKDDFSLYISEYANVIRSEVDTSDVTMEYVDTESRIKALRLEQETLEGLMKSSDSITDTIEIQTRLSEVIYEIESYESRLRALDADIDYTTFYLSIYEVEHESAGEKASVWERIGSGLSGNFKMLGRFFEELFILIVTLLPLWILLGVIAGAIVIIVKLSVRHGKKKREKLNAMAAAPNPAPTNGIKKQ